MNESSLRYAAYKSLLEGEITQDQYDFITEAGLVSRIIKSLRAAGGAASKTYKDEAYNDVQEYASQQLQKIVKQIYQAGAKAGQKKEEIDPIIAMILNQAMVDSKIENPALVFKALEKNPDALEAVSEPSAASASATGGGTTAVTADSIAANPSVAAALAAGPAGGSAADAAADAEKSKKDSKDILKSWIDGIVSGTGVEEKKTKKIAKALLDGEHIKIDLSSLTESLRRMRTMRAEKLQLRDPILERWQKLAGLNVISEGPATDEIVQGLKGGKIKNDDQVRSAVKGYEGDDLKDLESNKEEVVAAVKGNPAFPGFDKKLDGIIQDLKSGSEKSADDTGDKKETTKDEKSASSSGESKSASEDPGEYQVAFKDVRKRIADESITDDEILKVIKFIDVKDPKDASVSIS